jgi:shikimate dehydrogenase
MPISARTKVCAVIADPVEHSLSPQLHNAAFAACGLDFVYTAFHVRRGNVEDALRGVRALGIRGLSVTIPHKVDIIAHLDEVEEVARNTGSVNTVVNEDGRLLGYSTDGPGALRALKAAKVDPGGRRVLLLGSGGAARAIAFALAALDPAPSLHLVGVEEEELRILARDLGAKTPLEPESELLTSEVLARAAAAADIVVHATPVGMAPKVDESLLERDCLRAGQAVFDAVYTPFETKLLREAKAAGATTVAGLGMFVHQAAIQFELWTGRDAPVEVMTETVRKALGEAP